MMTETRILIAFAEEEKEAPGSVQVTPASDSEPSKDTQKADVAQDGQVPKSGAQALCAI